jgi:hypothetical protein
MGEGIADHPIRAIFATATGIGWPWWLIALGITSFTNLADFLSGPGSGGAHSPQFLAAAVARIALVVWLAYALIRKMAGLARPATLELGLLRFFLFNVANGLLLGACAWAATLLLGSERDPLAFILLSQLLLSLIVVMLVRLFAWQTALAIGDRSLGPVGAWRGLSGRHGMLAVAYLAILPFAVLHAVLTELAVRSQGDNPTLIVLAFGDGAVSSVQLALYCALAVIAWRLAGGEAGALPRDATVA